MTSMMAELRSSSAACAPGPIPTREQRAMGSVPASSGGPPIGASLMITCLGDALFARVGVAAVKVLRSLGVAVEFPAAQTCCGQPAYNAGYAEAARTSARAFLAAFAAGGYVVSISGSCAAMVRDGYPRLFAGRPEEAAAADLAARTFEFSEFLTDVLGVEELPVHAVGPAGRTGTARPPGGRVATFHHSCHTRRLLGVSEQPERLLGMVEGLEFRPLGHPELCCGFGGTFAVKMAAISSAMVDEKVDAVLASGADLLVGLDMSCLMNIEGRLRRREGRVEVRHLAEVLAAGWQT
jgi:L-lactate dehydrogenase complex protein LldE